jgi:hypothetical protein
MEVGRFKNLKEEREFLDTHDSTETGLRELADKERPSPFPFLSMIVKKEISCGSDEPHRPHNK